MTDKKKALLWLIEDSQAAESFAPILDRIVAEGNSSMLVLREDSLNEANGVFKATTSVG